MTGFENEESQATEPFNFLNSPVLDQQKPQRSYLSNRHHEIVTSRWGMSSSETQKHLSPTEDPLRSPNKDSFQKSCSAEDDDNGDSLVERPPISADVLFTQLFGNGSARAPGKEASSSSVSRSGSLNSSEYLTVTGSSFEQSGSSSSSEYLPVTGCPFPQSGSSSSSEYLTVTVTKPQKEHDETATSLVPGGNTYITYLIVTCTNIPEFGNKEFKVRRRFRDVVTLADRLSESYRGYFIPPRPDKHTVESQVMNKDEFIEQRRIAVEKYLGRLAAHPVIRKSKELMLFLKVQGRLPLPTTDMASRMLDGAVKLPQQLFGAESSTLLTSRDVVQPAKGGRVLRRMFKELRQYITHDQGGAKSYVVEVDKEFSERKKNLWDLEHCLRPASKQAEALAKTQKRLGETMGELGLAFFRLSKFENEEAPSNFQRVNASDLKCVGTAAVKASRLYRGVNAQSTKHLDQIHEYVCLMQAVHTAFGDRSDALLTVQTQMSKLSSMNSRVENLAAASSKIFGGDKTKNRKAEELRAIIKVTEEARDCAIREYECIKENNAKELVRFETERQIDFFNMLKGFIHNQVGYTERIANVWTKVAEEFNEYARRSAVSPIVDFHDTDLDSSMASAATSNSDSKSKGQPQCVW